MSVAFSDEPVPLSREDNGDIRVGDSRVLIDLVVHAFDDGATPGRALVRIALPLIAANIIAGGILAFAFAMLEVSDSLILAQQQAHFPITKAIYGLFKTLGHGEQYAAALGTWAMLFLGVSIIGASVLIGKKLGALFRV